MYLCRKRCSKRLPGAAEITGKRCRPIGFIGSTTMTASSMQTASLPTGTKTYGSASTSMSARLPPSKCGTGLVSWPGQLGIGHSNAGEGATVVAIFSVLPPLWRTARRPPPSSSDRQTGFLISAARIRRRRLGGATLLRHALVDQARRALRLVLRT